MIWCVYVGGKGDIMNFYFYRFLNLKFKQKDKMPKEWDMIVDQVDDVIADFLKIYGIDMDFLYTTNVGLLNVASNNQSSILWDLSYWAIYIEYLDFIFWMERERENIEGEAIYPFFLKQKIITCQSSIDANRLVFLATIFQYMSYKFYNDEELSYCFALLYDANKCSVPHKVSDEEVETYMQYIHEQLTVTKFFCAFHEAYHLKKIEPQGNEQYCERILYNVKTMVNSEAFDLFYNYDKCLIKDVWERVNLMNEQDHLFDELYSDAAALDLLDVVFNYMGYFEPKWTLDKFSLVVKEMLENFYSFNTLTYDLYAIWNLNLNLINGKITKDVYEQEVHKQDVEDVIRGQIFPAILWGQLDNILCEKGNVPPIPRKRYVNVRKEMTNFFDVAYNEFLKTKVHVAIKHGFRNSNLTIAEARDILIEWEKIEDFPNAVIDDLYLKGGTDDEIDFFMFVRGY